MIRFVPVFAVFALIAGPALAQSAPTTVSQLLADGWEVEGLMPSSAGPGILLQKDDRLIMCFVAETPDSVAITTQYCKPVE